MFTYGLNLPLFVISFLTGSYIVHTLWIFFLAKVVKTERAIAGPSLQKCFKFCRTLLLFVKVSFQITKMERGTWNSEKCKLPHVRCWNLREIFPYISFLSHFFNQTRQIFFCLFSGYVNRIKPSDIAIYKYHQPLVCPYGSNAQSYTSFAFQRFTGSTALWFRYSCLSASWESATICCEIEFCPPLKCSLQKLADVSLGFETEFETASRIVN